VLPAAEAARGHWVKGNTHAEGERGARNECSVFLTTPGYCNGSWRPGIEASGKSRGSAEARSMAAAPIRGRCSGVGSRGTGVGERDAAEGEREEAAGSKKGEEGRPRRAGHTQRTPSFPRSRYGSI
jgi:hypothetical protein